ncbi:MAG: hypothetical protein EOP04_00140 [Proteobacteria bacterium]|nr:MAG: hypothetical protein EOP04_00140 [Pseudomonadota bacterium]
MRLMQILTAAVILLPSCRTTTRSDIKHDAENPVASTSPHFYHLQSDDDYFHDALQKFWGVSHKDYVLDVKHPMVVRVQAWSDKIVSILKDRYPGTLTDIPDPIIKIVVSNTNNAFAYSMPLCFENVFFNPVTTQIKRQNPCREVIALSPRSLDQFGVENIVQEKASFAQLLTFVNNQNNSDATCKVQINILDKENFALKAGKGCKVSQIDLTSNLVVNPYTPYITLFSNNLKTREELVVATLYHELGHYFHAHGLVNRNIDFPFSLADWNEAAAPLESKQFASIKKDYLDSKEKLEEAKTTVASILNTTPKSIYKKSNGQKVSGILTPFIVDSVKANAKFFCEQSGTSENCKKCSEATTTAELNPILKFDVIGLVGDESQAVLNEYLEFESKAKNCLQDVNLVQSFGNESIDASIRSWNTFFSLLGPTTISNFEIPASFDPPMRASWWEYLTAIDLMLPERDEAQYARYLTLKPSIDQTSKNLQVARDELKSINDKFISEKLGFFSTEQEADDLSGEWLHLTGFSGTTMGDKAIEMIRKKELAQKCIELRAAKWRDSQGNPVIIPWGPLDIDHPDACFRARNADMEAIAHGFGSVAKSPAADLTPPWKNLVESLPTVESIEQKLSPQNSALDMPRPQQVKLKGFRPYLNCIHSQGVLEVPYR